MDHKQLNWHYARWGALAFAIIAIVSLTGCEYLSTKGGNFAGVNYGKYTMPNGAVMELAGGKDGTGVEFETEIKPDGSASIRLYAENYDATTVLVEANRAQQERIDELTSIILGTLTPSGVPTP